ncbi:protein kinase superfamily protein [Striga asiatica]|uniref:non-specific serine/threonine protein kinase n=1 Tax=Striga asiatica TaxID=4170 RepID=A0A5A7PCB5_STRAF|nr:protein kinase superfamily protein [Striga asiatica]
MPFPLQVLKHELKGLILSRIWSKFASGQIATSLGSFNSRNSLTGDFSSSESFLFPLSTALSELNDQYRKVEHIFKIDDEALLVHPYNALLIHIALRLRSFGDPHGTSLIAKVARMERFTIIKEVGNGTFGSVWRALSKQSGEVVAIKKMKKKYYSWEECINLREVKSLRKMNHPNVVKLKEVIRENDVLCFVFEYMECNLYQLMKDRKKPFSEVDVRNWCFQVFQGLAYIHQRGYFHRDLKPENLLVTKDTIKIADFGLAREINSRPPFTEYVSTRCEADEIYKICCVIGSPTNTEWPQGLELASAINYQFPQAARVHLSALMPGVSEDAVNLISSLCSWDPCKRPTAMEALQHPFFQSCFYIPPSLRAKPALTKTPPVGASVEQKSGRRYQGKLSNPKPQSSFSPARSQQSLNSGVQRKLELNNQDTTKNDKNQKNDVKQQPKYRPPGLNGPNKHSGNLGKTKAVSYAAEKLGNMALSPSTRLLTKRSSMPPPMKAGGWDLLAGRSQETGLPRRSYTRKVAG